MFECNRENARVWNYCLELNKKIYNEGGYVDRKYLQDNIKASFSDILTAKVMQVTCIRFMSAIKGINKARKAGRTDLKYSWRYKKYYNTVWDVSCLKIDYENNRIRIPKPQIGTKKQPPIWLKFKYQLPQNIRQVELMYKNGLKLAINYCIEEGCIQIDSDNICGVDLGEIHSIASIDSNGNSVVISGREIRSINRFRNKELGKLQRRLSYCKKGSRNYYKIRKAIRKLKYKTDCKMKYSIDKTTKLFLEYVILNNIKKIVIGNLKNYNMNLKDNYSNKQKLAQWNHGRMVKRIKEKVEKYGIEVIEISESYTSQTCPNCTCKYKPNGRDYKCGECGFEFHRDLVGSINILSKYINDGEIKPLDLNLKSTKYLRI